MTQASTLLSKGKILLLAAAGLLVFVFYIYYIVGIGSILEVVRQTNLIVYVLALFAVLTSIVFYALTWHSLLRNLGINMKIQRVLLLTWVGSFFDAVVPEPGLTGDFSKAYLMAKTSDKDPGRIAASVVGHKILVIAITMADLALGSILLVLNYMLPVTVVAFLFIVLVLSSASLLAICYFSIKPKVTKRILHWLIDVASRIRKGGWNPDEFKTRGEKILDRFHEGIHTLRSRPKSLARPIVFSALAWGLDLLMVFLVFDSLKYPVSVDKVLIVYAMTGSLQAMGLSFLGFTEIVMSSSYTLLGIPLPVSLAVTLLTRAITFWFRLAVSYFAFQWIGIELVRNRNGVKTAENP